MWPGLRLQGQDGEQAAAPAPTAHTAAKRAAVIDRNAPSLETPDVRGAGVLPAVNLGPNVTVSKDGISVDGEGVLDIPDSGVIDRRRLEVADAQARGQGAQ